MVRDADDGADDGAEARTRIVIADDHAMVREGFRRVLSAEADLLVVAEANDGQEAVELSARLRPHVLMLDLMMPRLGGMEAMTGVVKSSPETRILVVSMHSSSTYVEAAIRNGASGYILKDATARELVHAVREIRSGRIHIGRSLDIEIKTQEIPEHRRLTSRELQVLTLVATGYTSAQAARQLGIANRTVEVHRAHIMKKLNLCSLADLIRYAYRNGLLPPEST
jgi:DNA-binding NarL/FixJ family response regulator